LIAQADTLVNNWQLVETRYCHYKCSR